jgi:hypothetical protein
MNDPGPILQYASVQQGGQLCLPTDCRLYIQQTDTGVRILSAITGKGGAIGGMVFAVFILLLYSLFMLPDLQRTVEKVSLRYFPFCVFIPWALYAGLLLLVVDRTWRWDALDVSSSELRLSHWSIFARRSNVWDAADLRDVTVTKVHVVGRFGPHGQLQLTLVNSAPVLLFAGHDSRVLESAAARIRYRLLVPETPENA